MNTLASATAMAGARGVFLAVWALCFFTERAIHSPVHDDTYHMIYINRRIVKHFLAREQTGSMRRAENRPADCRQSTSGNRLLGSFAESSRCSALVSADEGRRNRTGRLF